MPTYVLTVLSNDRRKMCRRFYFLWYCISHRSASTTVLGEASGVVSRTHRKSMTDKILRSASEDCLRSIAPRAKTCNTNTLGKPSHVAKLCTSSAKHAKLAQKTADSHAKLPVHKSSSEVLLGQHRGTAAFKTGKRKHKSKQRLPNQTVSAPTSPGKPISLAVSCVYKIIML